MLVEASKLDLGGGVDRDDRHLPPNPLSPSSSSHARGALRQAPGRVQASRRARDEEAAGKLPPAAVATGDAAGPGVVLPASALTCSTRRSCAGSWTERWRPAR